MTHRLPIAALTLALLTTACGGKSPEQHVAQASQFLRDGQYSAATIELKSALKLDGDLAEARWLLGQVHLDTADFASAEKELLRADNLGWAAADVRPALARALLLVGKFEEVIILDVKGLPAQSGASVLSFQAMAQLAKGKTGAAEGLISQAFRQAPDSLDVKMAETKLMTSRGDITGALIVLEEILIEAPDMASAWSLKGDILMAQKIFPEALTAFSEAIALQLNPFKDRLKRAMIELQIQNLEAAQEDATWLLQKAPQHPVSNYIQGVLHYLSGDYENSVSALSLAEPVSQQFPLILFYLSRAHMAVGSPDQAGALAEKFYLMVPSSIQGRKLLASIYLQEGRYADVPGLIKPILDKNPEDVSALTLMANALLSIGDTEEGIELLAKVADLRPDSSMAQVRLGAGLMLAGQNQEAEKYLETTIDLNPQSQRADVLLVLNHLQREEFDQATEAALAYLSRHSGDVTPYSLLGKVYLASGQQAEAIEAFNRALRIEPGDPAANNDLAQLAIAAGDLADARQYYETILEHQPDYLPALLKLAELDAREQKEEAMLLRLDQAMEAQPTALQPRLILGRYYLGRGKPDQVAPLFATLGELQQQSPQVLQLLAMAQLSGGQSTAAEHTLEQLITANPNTASFHHLMAMAAEGTGDSKRAKQELQRAIALDPGYGPSLLVLAQIALAEHSYGEFDDYLAKLTTLAPKNPKVLSLQAVAAQREGDSAAAIDLASQAFKVAPSTATMQALTRHLGAAGNSAEARQILEQWVSEHPQDTRAQLSLASALEFDKQPEEASKLYAAVLEIDPDNITALNNLAWRLRIKDRPLAETYIQRAANLAPDAPDVLDTLAVIEFLQKDYRRAHRSIERALVVAPERPSLLYHRAMIEAAMGKKAPAMAQLQTLLADDDVNFAERADAETLLGELEGDLSSASQ